jgi:nitric oxide reductase activation protein
MTVSHNMLGFIEFITESDVEEASIARVNRVRSGQVQRRKVVSLRPGYKVQDGKLVRMTSQERMHRRLAQRKAARKRQPLLSRILRKRALSLRRRKSAGIK